MVSIDGEVAFGEAQPKNTGGVVRGREKCACHLHQWIACAWRRKGTGRTERSGQLSQHGVYDWHRDSSLSLVRERIAGGRV